VKDLYHDEVRFGATYADVVPEPASIGLMGLAPLGLLAGVAVGEVDWGRRPVNKTKGHHWYQW